MTSPPRALPPMAELHVHLEGTVTPAQARVLARRNGLPPPSVSEAPGGSFAWSSFSGFLRAYDEVAATLVTSRDYGSVAEAYLTDLARAGAVYAELTISPAHASARRLSWDDHLAGVSLGVRRAREATGIEARLIVTALRHADPLEAVELAERAAESNRSLVTGFGLAGDPRPWPLSAFAEAFDVASRAGLGCTVHAGELLGADDVRDALELPVARIGHGVAAAGDLGLIRELVDREIVLEICPSSNVALGVVDRLEHHPIRGLHDAGVRVTLNSDDPPHFGTTLAREHALARDGLRFSDLDLLDITHVAIQSAFVDEDTRRELLRRLIR